MTDTGQTNAGQNADTAAGDDQAVSPVKRRSGLGRGLGALLGDTMREEPLVVGATARPQARSAAAASAPAASGLAMLAVASITPNPDQPRRHFDEAALTELAQSIAARGVIQPVIVRPVDGGRYQIVAGERRWRAAQRAQLHEIPALVRDLDDRDVMALALIENIQRQDLNPVEEAQAYQRLNDLQGLSHQDIGKLVDKSRSHVANLMRLLALPPSVLEMVADARLSMGHARALINAPMAATLAHEVAAKGLSVRETEKLVRQAARNGGGSYRSRPPRLARTAQNDADIKAVENHLCDLLGLKVTIAAGNDPRTGDITVRYSSLDQLDLICQRLSGGAL